MPKQRICIVGCALLVCFSAIEAQADPTSASLAKRKIAFSLDQGFTNGVVSTNDQVSVDRVANALKLLQGNYDVYVILAPQVANKEFLKNSLDTLSRNGVSFILDAYTSDASSIAWVMRDGRCVQNPNIDPIDLNGQAVSIGFLQDLKARYGSSFAGIRIFEVLSQDFTFHNLAKGRKSESHCTASRFAYAYPDRTVYNHHFVRELYAFAFDNDLFIEWSEHTWSWHPTLQKSNKDVLRAQRVYESQVSALNEEYSSRSPRPFVYTTFANNIYGLKNVHMGDRRLEIGRNEISDPHTSAPVWPWAESSDWHIWARGVRSAFGAFSSTALGLSNQSWLCLRKDQSVNDVNCPYGNLVTWTWGAIEVEDARLIQFEPAWYFFKLPRGSIFDRTVDAAPDRGEPTEQFRAIESVLLRLDGAGVPVPAELP